MRNYIPFLAAIVLFACSDSEPPTAPEPPSPPFAGHALVGSWTFIGANFTEAGRNYLVKRLLNRDQSPPPIARSEAISTADDALKEMFTITPRVMTLKRDGTCTLTHNQAIFGEVPGTWTVSGPGTWTASEFHLTLSSKFALSFGPSHFTFDWSFSGDRLELTIPKAEYAALIPSHVTSPWVVELLLEKFDLIVFSFKRT